MHMQALQAHVYTHNVLYMYTVLLQSPSFPVPFNTSLQFCYKLTCVCYNSLAAQCTVIWQWRPSNSLRMKEPFKVSPYSWYPRMLLLQMDSKCHYKKVQQAWRGHAQLNKPLLVCSLFQFMHVCSSKQQWCGVGGGCMRVIMILLLV